VFQYSNYKLIGTLNEDHHRVDFLALNQKNDRPEVLQAVKAVSETEKEVVREQLKNEVEILKQLSDSDLIMSEARIIEEKESIALAIDASNNNLGPHITRKINLEEFFIISISLAQIVEHIHSQNIIHCRIFPGNLVWNIGSKKPFLVGFSSARRFNFEKVDEPDIQNLGHFLPYISPEQTGANECLLDNRTDLYSLGITLYQLLSGSLPFNANNADGWIECHLKSQPASLRYSLDLFPPVVEDIIFKLIAKDPDNRYQSARGLIYDLEECMNQWLYKRDIETFTLGDKDVSDKFHLRNNLYGRQSEINDLHSTFDKVCAGNSAMVMVSGATGMGKSMLVRELEELCKKSGGILIKGKYSRVNNWEPYEAITQAFGSILRRLAQLSENELLPWKEAFFEALGNNGSIITDFFPDMELIIGAQEPLQLLKPTEEKNRFKTVFRDFVNVFTRDGKPLVISIKNLENCDVSLLELFEVILVGNKVPNLLIVATYSDSNSDPQLISALNNFCNQENVSRIRLETPPEKAVIDMMSRVLNCEKEKVIPLTRIVYQKTKGNPFFVGEFLNKLYHDKVLVFDAQSKSWSWDQEQVKKVNISDKMVAILKSNLIKLPKETQSIIKLAACIGEAFYLDALCALEKQSVWDVSRALLPAIRQGLLVPDSDDYLLHLALRTDDYELNKGIKLIEDRYLEFKFSMGFKFQDLGILDAAYGLLKDEEKVYHHYRIGKLMLKHLRGVQKERTLLSIVSQLNRGMGLINSAEDKLDLARLNFKSAQKVKAQTAYNAALVYLKTTIDLLPPDHWQNFHQECFAIHMEYTRCCFLCSDFQNAEMYCNLILKQSKSRMERASVLRMQTVHYTVMGQLELAVQKAIEGLSILGIDLNEKKLKVPILYEMVMAKINLGFRKIPDLMQCKSVSSPEKKMCMRILIDLGAALYFQGNKKMFALVALKGLNLSLKYGNCAESSVCYAGFSMILGGIFGKWKPAFEFGMLGVKLNEQLGDIEFRSELYFILGTFIYGWTKPWCDVPQILRKSMDAGDESGNFFFMAHSCVNINQFHPTMNIDENLALMEKNFERIKQTKYLDPWYGAKIYIQFLICLRGDTDGRTTLSDDSFNESECLKNVRKIGYLRGALAFHLRKLQLFYFFGEYKNAVAHIEEGRQYIPAIMGQLHLVDLSFFTFLTYCAIYPKVEGEEKKIALRNMKKEKAKMKKWYSNCPENFSHQFFLMKAEMFRLKNKFVDAADWYKRSEKTADNNGYFYNKALICERISDFHKELGDKQQAEKYRTIAKFIFADWGASEKVKFMEGH